MELFFFISFILSIVGAISFIILIIALARYLWKKGNK